jgi:hypothetical protein
MGHNLKPINADSGFILVGNLKVVSRCNHDARIRWLHILN